MYIICFFMFQSTDTNEKSLYIYNIINVDVCICTCAYSEKMFLTLLIRRAINDVAVIHLNTILICWPINAVTVTGRQ